jgi:hypothetical protein
MAETKAATLPDTETLRLVLGEYVETLQDAERLAKKVLSLDPQTEEFWDTLSDLDPLLTLLESSSNILQEMSLDLVDQLPEDE